MKRKEKLYALELTGLFVSGLGMMLLIVVSAWAVSSAITVSDEVLGDSGSELVASTERNSFIASINSNAGQVAGVTDSSSTDENSRRNDAANWLSEARQEQGLNPAYREGVLDRNAQNHARLLADNCSLDFYNDWLEMIGTRTSEGYVSAFSEAVFGVSDYNKLSSELPYGEINYSRLFTAYGAYGVGVADAAGCAQDSILVLHLAEID